MTVATDTVALSINFKGFADGLIDNDEKVAFSLKYTQFKIRVEELFPLYDQSGQNRYPIYLWSKRLKNHTLGAGLKYFIIICDTGTIQTSTKMIAKINNNTLREDCTLASTFNTASL